MLLLGHTPWDTEREFTVVYFKPDKMKNNTFITIAQQDKKNEMTFFFL